MLEERIEWQRRKIAAAWRRYQPQIVGIEDYAFSKSQQGTRDRAELTGAVKNDLFRKSALVLVGGLGTIKLDATGNGGASKDEMVEAALTVWPQMPRSKDEDNLADAFHIAVWTAQELAKFAID